MLACFLLIFKDEHYLFSTDNTVVKNRREREQETKTRRQSIKKRTRKDNNIAALSIFSTFSSPEDKMCQICST